MPAPYYLSSVILFLFGSSIAYAQGLLPPEESENRQRIERFQEIIRTEQNAETVLKARCALALLQDQAQPEECEKLPELRTGRASRRVLQRRAKRIVNGLTTGAYPSAGALLTGISKETAGIACSGTLIACNKFLTAAHCFRETENPQAFWVYLPSGGVYPVAHITWPKEEFKKKDDEADLAIVTLQRPVHGIRPTPVNRSENGIPSNIVNSIVGFGRTGGSYSGGKLEDYGIKRVGYVQTAECKSSLENDKHICWDFNSVALGAELRSNTCNADSGGPLLNEETGQVLIGLTTAGDKINCDRNDHSWDVDIRQWRKWMAEQGITANTEMSCGAGPFVDVNRDVVEETRRIDNLHPEVSYAIETMPSTHRLSVAMNGEDDGNGTNDFDLYLIEGRDANGANPVCSQNEKGQFAYCEVSNPRPGPWRILVRRKFGEGLVQVTVTRLRQGT